MADFKRDLEQGRHYERLALHTFMNYGFHGLKIIDGYHKEYDISGFFKDKPVYIECKYSRYTARTKKFFIEVFTKDGTASGLTVTTSDYYILYSDFNYWIIKTKKLIKALMKHLKTACNIKDADFKNIESYISEHGIFTANTVGFIIPMHTIEKYAKWCGTH